MDKVEQFYSDKIVSSGCNLYLYEILEKDDFWWDNNHNFIQDVFPLHEKSKFNDNSFLIQDYITDRKCCDNMQQSINRFVTFIMDNRVLFLHNFNHNHLRITRFLRSIRFFNFKQDSMAYFKLFKSFTNNNMSINFWEKATYENAWDTMKPPDSGIFPKS